MGEIMTTKRTITITRTDWELFGMSLIFLVPALILWGSFDSETAHIISLWVLAAVWLIVSYIVHSEQFEVEAKEVR